MKLVVGLGNPGAAYANTPHSVGFEVVDAIAASIGATWELKKAFSCLWARGSVEGVPVLLVKPQTYMNLSGDSVAPLVKYQNLTLRDLIVVQDDIDLAVGRLRVREGGSCGGHNGIRSLIARLGDDRFARVKLGVGRSHDDVVAHVLGKFPPTMRQVMDCVVAEATKAVAIWLHEGPQAAMNACNGFKAEG